MSIANVERTELTLRECQVVELELMKELHEYFDKHDIKYVIGAGTLLGAVRHQGFIPWDNDFDILMPRPDYERFINLVDSIPISPNAYVVNSRTDKNYFYSNTRVCDARTTIVQNYTRTQPTRMGVWIDIFPVDGVPDNLWEYNTAKAKIKLYQTMQKIMIYRLGNRGMVHGAQKLFCDTVANDGHLFERKLDEVAMSCPYGSTRFVADVTEISDMLKCLTPWDFDNPILLDFEDAQLCAPQNWDLYLRTHYGNYLELPPEKDRVPHNFRAYWA